MAEAMTRKDWSAEDERKSVPRRAFAYTARMRAYLAVLLCIFSLSAIAVAQDGPRDPEKLLDHLAGKWLAEGPIAGQPAKHDIEAHWVLNREYLEIHEESRERRPDGSAAYQAIIFVSWDAKRNEFACLWLDSTEGGALTSDVTCRATPERDSIPFVFTISAADSIRTTFRYDGKADSWEWTIDNVTGEKRERFADLKLTRVKVGS